MTSYTFMFCLLRVYLQHSTSRLKRESPCSSNALTPRHEIQTHVEIHQKVKFQKLRKSKFLVKTLLL